MLQPFMHILNSQRLVLASGSPRRKQILENIGLKIEVIPSNFEENLDKSEISPQQYVVQTASCKVEEVAQRLSSSASVPDLIIGADTVVSRGNDIIEKPKDREDAIRILSSLSGQSHNVYTGVILCVPATSSMMPQGTPVLDGAFRLISFVEGTEVHMACMSKDVIESYVDTGESMDKAGGYGIQAIGGTLVEKINGDYFNVMGFPLSKFAKELSSLYAGQNKS